MWKVEFLITLGNIKHVDHVQKFDRYEQVDTTCSEWLSTDPTYINFGIRCRSCKITSESEYFYKDGLMYADARSA